MLLLLLRSRRLLVPEGLTRKRSRALGLSVITALCTGSSRHSAVHLRRRLAGVMPTAVLWRMRGRRTLLLLLLGVRRPIPRPVLRRTLLMLLLLRRRRGRLLLTRVLAMRRRRRLRIESRVVLGPPTRWRSWGLLLALIPPLTFTFALALPLIMIIRLLMRRWTTVWRRPSASIMPRIRITWRRRVVALVAFVARRAR